VHAGERYGSELPELRRAPCPAGMGPAQTRKAMPGDGRRDHCITIVREIVASIAGRTGVTFP
jgi:hypothetical protein